MEINVFDYLGRDEIREIAIDELRKSFWQQLKNETEIERVLVNLSYEYVFKQVCNNLKINEEDLTKRIMDGVEKALESDHIKFHVFRRKDAWDKTESPAVKILDNVLSESRPKIEEEVNKRISQYPFRELQEEIDDTIYDCIIKCFRGQEDKP